MPFGDKNEIVITGEFRFPDGDAAAARVLGLGKALRASGFSVTFAGWERQGRSEDRDASGNYTFHGFPYFPQGDLRSQPLPPVKRFLRYVRAGSNTLNWLRQQDTSKLLAVIAYHGNSRFFVRLQNFCRSQGIRLIVDCTEWYDFRSLPGGLFGFPHWDNELKMRFLNKRADRLIVISGFLERYYSRAGCVVLNVPPMVDFSDPKWRGKQEPPTPGHVSLVYAGTPGKKDLLAPVLRGMRHFLPEASKLRLHLIGPTYEDLLAAVNGDRELMEAVKPMLVMHGRVPQESVPSLLKSATFSVLLRPDKRYAHAGFSTKLVESLAAGVPVITNNTGDISTLVRDGSEGFLIPGADTHALVEGLRRALNASASQLQQMRASAKAAAMHRFDYQAYASRLRDFVAASDSEATWRAS